MRSAHELIQELQIDDFDVLKHNLEIAINNIVPTGYRYKHAATKLLSTINTEADIGKLDLATLAFVLSELSMPGDQIQFQDPQTDPKKFFEPLAFYQACKSAFAEAANEDDVVVVSKNEVPRPKTQTRIDQAKEFAHHRIIEIKHSVGDAIDDIDLDAHYKHLLAVTAEVKKKVSSATAHAIAATGQTIDELTGPANEAAFNFFHAKLFNQPRAESDESDESQAGSFTSLNSQPPLP